MSESPRTLRSSIIILERGLVPPSLAINTVSRPQLPSLLARIFTMLLAFVFDFTTKRKQLEEEINRLMSAKYTLSCSFQSDLCMYASGCLCANRTDRHRTKNYWQLLLWKIFPFLQLEMYTLHEPTILSCV